MNIICGVAARSGGHIIPCLTKIEKEKTEDTQVIFFTTHTILDASISKQFPWITRHVTLTVDNVPYKKPWLFPLFIWQFTRSFFTSFVIFLKKRPAKIISSGGYLSLPVCFAARCAFVPVELFELNVKPGRASRVLAPFANKLSTCFKDTQNYFKRSCSLEPYPVRFAPSVKDKQHKEEALTQLGYSKDKKTILILGGSQGSVFLNSSLCAAMQQLDRSELQVIHQAGNNELAHLKLFYVQMQIPAHVFAYEQNLVPYYQAADIVVCRSGAGTLFETAFFEKPCITIPLEIASNTHQVDNALAMQAMHPDFFTVIKQADIETLATQLLYLLKKPTHQEQ